MGMLRQSLLLQVLPFQHRRLHHADLPYGNAISALSSSHPHVPWQCTQHVSTATRKKPGIRQLGTHANAACRSSTPGVDWPSIWKRTHAAMQRSRPAGLPFLMRRLTSSTPLTESWRVRCVPKVGGRPRQCTPSSRRWVHLSRLQPQRAVC